MDFWPLPIYHSKEIGKIDQKWLQMGQNGYFWVIQMVQMSPGIPTPNSLTKNGEIWTKNWVKLPKMAENRPKWVIRG